MQAKLFSFVTEMDQYFQSYLTGTPMIIDTYLSWCTREGVLTLILR